MPTECDGVQQNVTWIDLIFRGPRADGGAVRGRIGDRGNHEERMTGLCISAAIAWRFLELNKIDFGGVPV